ncbi:HNH endonuclease [Geodermatophilus sp. YIM 151500]|uniref:HNH endonuclease signature motif containing protein n=1 Tax=Geodermatophilus sp. YIM 151500 TaxID=2984531 RepID=UPI0021E3B58B|nr:HNH endonuclease signature motif containing protein [Geodermatophilus sp. YIM 151500]MCV2488292.1 HNH endonuclease [Geodermatophilus sp. YIM 151500]
MELVSDIWAADAHAAREHARKAEAIARLARRRRRDALAERGDRGGRGLDSRMLVHPVLAEVSEDFVAELALIRNCSPSEAEALAVEAILLTTSLQPTWSELYAGRIDVRKMRAVVDLLGQVDPEVAARVQQRVLPKAEQRTVAWLRATIHRQLARLDSEAVDRRRAEKARQADVRAHPVGDGMSQLVADLPTPAAAACADAVDQYAKLLRADGDTRPIGMLRASVLHDLILRPWDTSRPPVTAVLSIHAPLPSLHPALPSPATSAAAPADAGAAASTGPLAGGQRAARPDGQPACEVNGQVVTAEQCRALLQELDMLGVRQAPPGGCVQVAIGDPATGRLVAVATRRELRRAAGSGRRRRRRGAATRTTIGAAAATGDGVGLTSADGSGLRPPPATTSYSPTAAQRRFVTVRDRHCRMPGCRRRPGRLDIDHAVAHADGGATDCCNLCCLCRTHHRIKTFARGWRFEFLSDGRLIVRTPSGVTRTTAPPGYCWDDEPDPPWLDEQAPPDPLLV